MGEIKLSAKDVLCPVCGTVNKSIDLEETDGWMECENCGNTVRTLDEDNSDQADGCQWQVMQKLPYRA